MNFKNIILGCLLISALSTSACFADTPSTSQKSHSAFSPIMQKLLKQFLEQSRRQPVEESSRMPEGACFRVPFKNETDKAVEVESLLPASYILLDGKQYQWSGNKPDSHAIAAGESYPLDLSPDDYVPRVKRSIMADSLKRWRWASTIEPGDHKVIFFLGGKHYGPVSFSWTGTGAWNVPCE